MRSRMIAASLLVALVAWAGCGEDDAAQEGPSSTEATEETRASADEDSSSTEAAEETRASADEDSSSTEAIQETEEPVGAEGDQSTGITTAVTTGNVIIVESFDESGSVGEPELQIEVEMEDGQVRTVATDEETLMTIWPDGLTASGVLVTIEVIDGQERVTGPAD